MDSQRPTIVCIHSISRKGEIMIEDKGFRDQSIPSIVDTEYKNCSFAQAQPVEVNGLMVGVRIFPDDDTPRTFTNCNLVNCELPPNSTIIKCNTTIAVRGVSVVTDTIVIGGETIEITEIYDYIHGRYDAETVGYIYRDSPTEVKA